MRLILYISAEYPLQTKPYTRYDYARIKERRTTKTAENDKAI
jgi:hypothetical protein